MSSEGITTANRQNCVAWTNSYSLVSVSTGGVNTITHRTRALHVRGRGRGGGEVRTAGESARRSLRMMTLEIPDDNDEQRAQENHHRLDLRAM